MTTVAPDFMTWTWADIEPRYAELQGREVAAENVDGFLRDWTHLSQQVDELGTRLKLETDQNTADEAVAERFRGYVEEIQPKITEAEHRLTEKLLETGLTPAGMDVPLRGMRVEAEIFREENLPLQSEETLLAEEFLKITGNQSVEWEGKEIPLPQLLPVLEEPDRARREQAWRLGASRRLQDRDAISEVWRQLLDLRTRIAANAGFSDYRSYAWKALKRFDYTPEDAYAFHHAVERFLVPVVSRLYEQRRQRLGIGSVRPWDREVDVSGEPPLKPYDSADELEEGVVAMLHHVDPVLAGYMETMRSEGLLDLQSRTNKGPGAYCTNFAATGRPFIFGNAAGIHDDVITLLHEGGHAFHAFEMAHLPYEHQKGWDAVPMEFAEVGSMSMELLAAPYLTRDQGGFYAEHDAARARLAHLESILTLLCWICVVDAFQHWAYEHPEEAADPDTADDAWERIYARFLPFVDWSGLEAERRFDWRRVPHMFIAPFYFLEYAIAQLGAIQVWANARGDQRSAVEQYRHALSLGGTATVPDLFAAAGARFAFDEETLREAAALVESTIEELEEKLSAGT
jgi:oligoendopeptidase F